MKNTKYAEEIAEMTVEMMVEAMPESKLQVFRNACCRSAILTSYYGLGFSTLTIYKEGYYLEMQGCRSGFAVFVKDMDGELEVTRKPKDSKLSRLWGWSWMNEMPKALENYLNRAE